MLLPPFGLASKRGAPSVSNPASSPCSPKLFRLSFDTLFTKAFYGPPFVTATGTASEAAEKRMEGFGGSPLLQQGEAGL
jgi:hypothetical protein